MIYAFLSQKGGVGKTTLSVHLADALARRGSRVLLVDADPQQSAMKWSTFRAGENKFSVIAMAKPTLHKELAPIYADYTDIVIDGPPRIHELTKSIILAADLVLIPRATLAAGRVGDRRDRRPCHRGARLQGKP